MVMGTRTPKVTESQHQIALMRWWSVSRRRWKLPENALLHITNEGKRSVITGAKLKALGLRPGTADLVLAVPRGGYGSLWIEMKTETGRASSAQTAFIRDMQTAGNKALFCHGWIEASKAITDYLDLDAKDNGMEL